ncbi:ABC transporter permease [Pseudoxanthomonas wuyuanensis]|uniref:ABC-2 type transport system permease protein n=1 Tax=Pseudoxanthomonas wuyuanensis TaxID=1073196 RepID=A0A286CXQ8_9GAMM|nr:ABC transporter permease [Pseudoxanthomonas wuyuanensis]KAF1722614.1 ABC transporter permease [Pseudoxanthomonas wuyuanensis]SOD51170.1 ABC-2 type transport system permease protein [Pseudoxanthomonas wuyuanensis]
MNAVTTAHASKGTAFKWLLKREFWENRGGFFWAPVVTGAIVSALTLIASIIGVVKVKSNADFDINIGDDAVEYARQIGAVGDGILMGGLGLTQIVLAFVVFFYALGTLYDDRRDRSVLFWKSLPVSDTQMVLSKATWALLLAPVLSIVIGMLVGLVLWIITAGSMAVMGVPGGLSMFTHSHPLTVIGNALSTIPLYLFWALPAVGWLMFCSAWARSKPFLWAVLIPVLACVMVSMLGILGIKIPYAGLWYTVVYRGLLSVLPGAWSPRSLQTGSELAQTQVESPADLIRMLNLGNNWHIFGTADLWIGAVAGIALIAGAIYLRRWRESD